MNDSIFIYSYRDSALGGVADTSKNPVFATRFPIGADCGMLVFRDSDYSCYYLGDLSDPVARTIAKHYRMRKALEWAEVNHETLARIRAIEKQPGELVAGAEVDSAPDGSVFTDRHGRPFFMRNGNAYVLDHPYATSRLADSEFTYQGTVTDYINSLNEGDEE